MSALDTMNDETIRSMQAKNELLIGVLERHAIRAVIIDVAAEMIIELGKLIAEEPPTKKEVYKELKQAAIMRGYGTHTYDNSQDDIRLDVEKYDE